ncbi:toll-like receptor 4 [Haliotis cracherodii]|uniref:toll-like receptor 4 n=1 Tax=Haliotis cracherodii TaxID=6455 RepID=UPI0039EBF643
MDLRCLLLCLAQIMFRSHIKAEVIDLCNLSACDCKDTEGRVAADCRNGGFTEIPKNPFNNTRICGLNLGTNNISALKGYDFLWYTNLTFLDLSFNLISDIENNTFVGLDRLLYLDLAGNKVSSFPIPDVLAPLTSLQMLNISVTEGFIVRSTIAFNTLSSGQVGVNGTYSEGLHVKYLSFSGSHIKHLPGETFHLFPWLEYLNMSFCQMETVEPGALSSLIYLRTLDVSGNRDLGFLGVQNITTGLGNSKLRNLIINQIVKENSICVIVPKTLASNLQNTSLYMLEANSNRIEIFHEDVFSLLPKTLEKVTIQSTRFTYGNYVHNLQHLSGLRYLDLSRNPIQGKLPVEHNALFEWSSICDDDQCLTYEYIDIDNQDGSNEFLPPKERDMNACLGIPPNLTTFKLSNHRLSFELSKMCFKENILRYIDLSNNAFTRWTGPVFGLENVTNLYLSGNSANHISPHFFSHFTSLTHLDLSHNSFGFPNNHCKDRRYFRNQRKLEYLNMSFNGIFLLHRDFLIGLRSLRILDFSYNSIFNLSFNFEHNTHLININCAYNNIKTITPYGRSQMKLLPDLRLDLSYNPLLCTCENIDFFDWLLSAHIASNLQSYHCVNKERHTLSLKGNAETILTGLKVACYNVLGITLGVLTTLLLILFFVSSLLCYRYRWKIIYWFYVIKLKLRNNRNEYICLFDFDVYVSYADPDLGFVRNDMIQILEHLRGTRLYIRDRDSIPGAPISENIIDGIRRSRKTVLLLSRAFLKKKWCRYELHMANMESVSTGRSVMVIMMLEDIPNKDIPLEILYDIQKSRFLDYPKTSNGLELFWANVTAAIEG